MNTDYVQLPPLPADTTTKAVEIIWLFTKLKRNEQILFCDHLKNMLGNSDVENNMEKLSKLLREGTAPEANPEVMEFAEQMKRMIGELIVEACELAGLVYEQYFVNKKSLKEIAREMNVDEDILRLIAQYYDLKNKN